MDVTSMIQERMDVTSMIRERMDVTSMIRERMDVTSMIQDREDGCHVYDPHWPTECLHFGYTLFCTLLDITTKVNYFDDLTKFFFKRLRMLLRLLIHYTFGHQ